MSEGVRGGRPAEVFVGRAELVLARDHRFPLREVPMVPDPMTGLVRAVAEAGVRIWGSRWRSWWTCS